MWPLPLLLRPELNLTKTTGTAECVTPEVTDKEIDMCWSAAVPAAQLSWCH